MPTITTTTPAEVMLIIQQIFGDWKVVKQNRHTMTKPHKELQYNNNTKMYRVMLNGRQIMSADLWNETENIAEAVELFNSIDAPYY